MVLILKGRSDNTQRDLGLQPIAKIMFEHDLEPNDLASNSTEQISHKMISRIVKGRRLTLNIQIKILNALNETTKKLFTKRFV